MAKLLISNKSYQQYFPLHSLFSALRPLPQGAGKYTVGCLDRKTGNVLPYGDNIQVCFKILPEPEKVGRNCCL